MKQKIKIILMAFIMSIGLVMTPKIHSFDVSSYERMSNHFLKFTFHLFYEIMLSIEMNRLIVTGLFIFLFIWLTFLAKSKIKINWIQYVLSAILAIFAVSASAFYVPDLQKGTWDILFEGGVQTVKTVIMFTGWLLFYNCLQRTLMYMLTIFRFKEKESRIEKGHRFKLPEFMKKHVFISALLIYIILLIPIVLIDFPGTVSYDTLIQLIQFNGDMALRNDHPIFSTALFGNAVKLATKMGNPSLGVFFHALYQMVGSAVCVAYTAWVINKLTTKIAPSYIYASFAALVPILNNLITVPVKDTMFSHSFAVVIATVCLYMYDREVYFAKKAYLMTAFALTFAILLRKNAIYALVPVLIVFIPYALIKLIQKKGNHVVLIAAVMMPLLFSAVIENALISYYDVENTVLEREKYSVPFQQTARYVKKYKDEIPKEEAEIIDKVIDYDKLPKLYLPTRSDPVKESFREKATDEDIKAYLGVWAKQLKTHPVVYFEATMHQIFPLFTMTNHNGYYASLESTSKITPWTNSHFDIYNLKQPQINTDLSLVKMSFAKMIDNLPVLGLFNNYSVYIILMLMLLAIALYKKMTKVLWAMLPTLLLLGTLIVGPLMLAYHRYYIPFVLIAPIYLTLVYLELNKKKVKPEEDALVNDSEIE